MQKPTKLRNLPLLYRGVPLWVLQSPNNDIALIDGDAVGTGVDIVLLFSTEQNARDYAAHYASLSGMYPRETTIGALLERFADDRVEYFTLDLPASHFKNEPAP